MPDNREPLFKFEPGGGHVALAVVLTGAFACAALYIAGVIVQNPVMTGVAMALAVLVAVIGVLAHRAGSKKAMDADEIERAVRRYEDDVRRTFVAYSIDYDEDDVKRACDEYRRKLESDAPIEVGNPIELAAAVARVAREERAGSKDVKREYKQARKERRALRRAGRKSKRG